jgi:hypothetical protein
MLTRHHHRIDNFESVANAPLNFGRQDLKISERNGLFENDELGSGCLGAGPESLSRPWSVDPVNVKIPVFPKSISELYKMIQ